MKKEGSLWGWGQNESGQVGDGTTSNKFTVTRISPDHDWKSIAAGSFNGYAIKSNGTVWGWGLGTISGATPKKNALAPVQIDPGTNWTSVSASDYILLALKSDGTLWIRGQNAQLAAARYVTGPSTNFTRIGTNTDWQEVYAGQYGFFARKKDRSWWFCSSGLPGNVQLFGLPLRRPITTRAI